MTKQQAAAIKVGDTLRYYHDVVEVEGIISREDYPGQLDADRIPFPLFRVHTEGTEEVREITYRLLTVPLYGPSITTPAVPTSIPVKRGDGSGASKAIWPEDQD